MKDSVHDMEMFDHFSQKKVCVESESLSLKYTEKRQNKGLCVCTKFLNKEEGKLFGQT